jgi:hypothetical protein
MDGMGPKYMRFLFLFSALVLMTFFRYHLCDVGTFPKQTTKDNLEPPTALHSNASRAKYTYRPSLLSLST